MGEKGREGKPRERKRREREGRGREREGKGREMKGRKGNIKNIIKVINDQHTYLMIKN